MNEFPTIQIWILSKNSIKNVSHDENFRVDQKQTDLNLSIRDLVPLNFKYDFSLGFKILLKLMNLRQQHCNEENKLKISYHTIYVGISVLSFLLHKEDFIVQFFLSQNLCFESDLSFIVGVTSRSSPSSFNSPRTAAVEKDRS